MFSKSYQKLEINKIIDILKEHCTFKISKDLIDELEVSQDLDLIKIWQIETTEAKEILRFHPLIPLGGLRDIRGSIRRAEIGALLNAEELLNISSTLRALRRLKNFIKELKEEYPFIKKLAEELFEFIAIEKIVAETIDEEAKVKDNASSDLSRIRKKILTTHDKIRTKLDDILRSQQKYLQDNLITIRNNRYVVPVKQEYRAQFGGIVHDQSSSGATLFIEPLATIELNNEIKKLEIDERNEVEKILRHISDLIMSQVETIRPSLENIAYLDYVFARAKLSNQFDCSEPVLNNQGKVKIINGRHPLIRGKVVPITIELGYDFHSLIITGPNTGGKTVSLKTTGLLSIMGQLGLHIPADPGSEIAIFKDIYADIGDEQSIEQSLSTFSSHLTNIIKIIKAVDKNSLVLIDELGAGTDPTEGAALARAILEFLHERQVRTIATTHYSELKTFAYAYPGVKNASVEFDTETLRPTYKLLIGVPGRSNALEIAYRLGLPKNIIDNARLLINKEDLEVADIIQDLEESRRKAEDDRRETQELKEELADLRQELKKRERELKLREKEIKDKALLEAEQYLRTARMEADELVRTLKTTLTVEAQKAQDQAAALAKAKLNSMEKEIDQLLEKNNQVKLEEPKNLKIGDTVFLNRLQQKGDVLEIINAKELLVQVGIMKINVKLKDVSKVPDERKQQELGRIKNIIKSKSSDVKSELDLRGLLAEEAIQEVDKYLDNAVLANMPSLYLIHGKGTGALRKAINDFLVRHPHVKNFRLGDYGEGGSGVTVVTLK